MNDSTRLAREVVAALLAADVREVVLAPGSRNAPLSFAVHDAAQAGLLRLHTRTDERTAAFLALGLTKVGSRAAVICTSGTAVANLHPAVMEAAHAGVRLVVVTADRPARLRGTGANQTTDQIDAYGDAAAFLDLDASASAQEVCDALGPAEGPVHLNVQLDDPLMPDGEWRPAPADVRVASVIQDAPRRLELDLGPRTVVVAGDDAGPPARVLAEKAGWPLLAEPSSGCRTGDAVIRTYRLLLAGDLGRKVERVVVFGHPTLSRPVSRLLARDDVEVVAVRHAGIWAERPFPVVAEADGVRLAGDVVDDPSWLEEWRAADRTVSRDLDRLLAAEPDLTPHEVAGAVSRALPRQGLLVVGASNPIRDLDLMVAPYEVGGRRKVIANRGLAGIDGTISSAIGAALGRPQSSRAIALVGDVTFLHDTTGLFLGPREERPDLTIVVVNDDGGSIFATLEQGAPAYADRFDTLFGTPHGVDLASLCAAARVPHLRVTGLPELEQALAMPNGGIEVVEARVRRDNRADLDKRIRALVL
ncbi:2-succinyl-5-enolpyruvyl-6-hydroxy-3-cyclohexene-1-carboxylic-acid synthase [Nocardioides glacieisoli]|uniref:2-succinyl-5-enolpyruvyl-6-hydroxy-3-cyclohexene-1-carboxylate synthase n=1 Tax=Nocardioides glacieisoli TaxID=1168730 RepID=A0A4Q2RPC9_9ACTN|nr:2-succinyl-5-enolpyruvyl-6-hydroxy-3-cyclohexene-1-carboxylic-acid synthase [Nocardioides glacieisoli]RYB90326.1 2-succinyl-5-enolpyruvyl-6-hydroxy-3-cyclohexene-1-carboxylic-acid synthase [Nocardioides glacieisoli]